MGKWRNGVQEEGIVRPRKSKLDPAVGPDVIFVMVPGDIEHLLQGHGASEIESYDMSFFRIHHLKGERPLFLAGPFLGAPQAVMGMEKLIALGTERLWAMGWCGSIQPHLQIGRMLLPTDAVSEEGTSRHYPLGDRVGATDEGMNGLLAEALHRRGEAFSMGTVWTTDAPYRETPSKVKTYQQMGVLAVEMEISALITLAAYRSVKIAALLVVSDELFDLQWRPGFRNPAFLEATRTAGEVLTAVVKSWAT